jgi:P-type Ca2+ transporter type 2C
MEQGLPDTPAGAAVKDIIHGTSPGGQVSESVTGLSEVEAASRLRAHGPNELPQQRRRGILRIGLDVVREPMFGLLIASGVIYLLLGDRAEALALLAFASVSVVVTIIQETRSERVLTALRELSSPRALVIRGEQRRRIPGREVVRGDVMLLSEGDRVPADGTILSCDDLLVDESLLTGESVPVRKAAGGQGPLATRAGGEDLPFVFSGSLVVRGNALVVVSATGPRSEIGKIGATLGAIENTPPRLTLQTRQLVRQVAVAGLTVCVLAVLLYGLTRGDWLQALLAGLALGMSMLPEEFPLVLTVFMAMGAWRISRARVLTRRAAAIEALGSATVLCTDKTGTLTENRMRIAELRAGGTIGRPGEAADFPEPCQALLEFGLLASAAEGLDPMDQAFHALAAMLPATPHCRLVRSWGLRPVSWPSPCRAIGYTPRCRRIHRLRSYTARNRTRMPPIQDRLTRPQRVRLVRVLWHRLKQPRAAHRVAPPEAGRGCGDRGGGRVRHDYQPLPVFLAGVGRGGRPAAPAQRLVPAARPGRRPR